MDILDDMGVSKLSAKVFFFFKLLLWLVHPKMMLLSFTQPQGVPNL